MYDVVIIGAGVSGAAVARELSRYQLSVAVLEKEEDVCTGTSKANSAIVHAGYDAENGTLKAKLNVRGNAMMDDLCRDLDIPFMRNGSLVVCIDEDHRDGLDELLQRGIRNGVEGLRILEKDEVLAMEPNLTPETVAALYAPSAGIVCPFELTIALSENAAENGVEFFFNKEVTGIARQDDGTWTIETPDGNYAARYIINAAGVYADQIHNMVSSRKIVITPRRGEYCLLDHDARGHVHHTVFPQPTKYGKGILISPTIHGNLIVGPTATDTPEKDGTHTTAAGLADVIAKASHHVVNLPMNKVITSFAGLRAHEEYGDFLIGEVEDAPGFIDVAGIESPGLSASPAIGEMVRDIVCGLIHPAEKAEWKGTRKGLLKPSELSVEERNALIKKNPAYGTVICRCETVTEGEIIESLHRIIPARSLDGVKRRTRAGMGRCQSGFCSQKVMEIINRELGLPYEQITKSGGSSQLVYGRTKEVEQ